ncbi:counting factor 60 [Pelomyxa schiedti]|nr:counting factor 60 [Pelomyxa schiedti]
MGTARRRVALVVALCWCAVVSVVSGSRASFAGLSRRGGGAVLGGGYKGYCGTTEGQPVPPLNLAPNATTKLVALVTRHGDRVPLHTTCWPGYDSVWNCSLTKISDPDMTTGGNEPSLARAYRENYMYDRNELLGNCEKAALTDIGNTQCTQLGQAMRSYFVDTIKFLPDSLHDGDVFVRFDGDSRTKQSAMAFCDGLYPPSASGGDTTSVIDMFTMDYEKDDMFPNSDLCSCVTKYGDAVKTTPEWINYDNTVVDPIEQQFIEIFGASADINGITFWYWFYLQSCKHYCSDCGHSMQCHDMPLPAGLTEELLIQVFDAVMWQTAATYSYPDPQSYGRIAMGLLLGDIMDQMLDAVDGAPQPKISLFSAHDSSVMVVLSMLGIWDELWPSYASYIMFELYTVQGKDFIRVVYNGKQLPIPGCLDVPEWQSCSFESFYGLAKQLIPTVDQCSYDCPLPQGKPTHK